MIEGAQVIITETSIEKKKIHVLNESFKPLPYVPGLLKMIEVIPACIYHNALFPLSETSQRYKGYAFLD